MFLNQFSIQEVMRIVLILRYRVNPQRLHLVSSLLCNGQELFGVWEGIHDGWEKRDRLLKETIQ